MVRLPLALAMATFVDKRSGMVIDPNDNSAFRKRIFDVPTFFALTGELIGDLGTFKGARRDPALSAEFSERIMLAVTQVNGCRYCSFVHTRMALASGVSRDELALLAGGEFDGLPQSEQVALAFAQHYAETLGNYDPDTWTTLVETYGEDTALHIRAVIRSITIGNLTGNTLDALLSRLRGRGAPHSTAWQEIASLLSWGIVGPHYAVRWLLSPAS